MIDKENKNAKKKRLDEILVDLGLVVDIQKSRALILAGEVLVNNVPCTKAGNQISNNSEVRLRGIPLKYVSRGGDKLEGAIKDLKLNILNYVCLDVGASTGGFTDCLLQHGAKYVYSIDVGKNQLDHKLRVDNRVKCYEETHVKDLQNIEIKEELDLVVIDVSFINLMKVLPFIIPILKKKSLVLMLVKPQFELGGQFIDKNGAPAVGIDSHQVVDNLKSEFPDLGLKFMAEVVSRVKGKRSENQEYFVLAEML